MPKCISCGKNSLFSDNFGSVVLCKHCASTIDVPSWKNRDFTSLDELITQRNEVIGKALSNAMPQYVVDEIARYFDEYINAGFITSINGKAGQTLKVFATHCIITTKSELKKTELENMFSQFVDDEEDDDNDAFSTDEKRSLVMGLMSGKIVQAGLGAAVSATLRHQDKEKAAEKRSREIDRNLDRLITVGERYVNLAQISSIVTYSRADTANGYLKLIKNGGKPDALFDCEYFFFNNSIPFESRNIRRKVDGLKRILEERISALGQGALYVAVPNPAPVDYPSTAQTNVTDAFADIRKYKELLDEGIITEEEFAKKKKELLGL